MSAKKPKAREQRPPGDVLRKVRAKMNEIVDRDGTTWKELSELVSMLAGVHPSICENVLRALWTLDSPEMDRDCDFANAIANLDPSAEEG